MVAFICIVFNHVGVAVSVVGHSESESMHAFNAGEIRPAAQARGCSKAWLACTGRHGLPWQLRGSEDAAGACYLRQRCGSVTGQGRSQASGEECQGQRPQAGAGAFLALHNALAK
jgi:hypothetical protein